jgi:selenocysteine lyase/cysteine desulfurase
MKPLVDPSDFPATRNHAYLNTASVALMYRGAHEATMQWLQDIAEEGTVTFDEIAEETVFDDLHRAAARLLNARPEDIAVGSNATELLASLAWALSPAQNTNIVSTETAFPSTVYPWARVARHTKCDLRLARSEDHYVDAEQLLKLIDDATAVVCISDVEYATGQRYDVAMLAETAHAHGALLVIDATQSAGAVPIDVTAVGVDALVTAGYKWLCGPFGVAIMYLAPHLQATLDPGVVGFRSHRAMWDLKAGRLELPATARRFEFSTMAYGCAIGLARSIEYLLEIGIDRIFDHDRELADRLIEGLLACGAELVSPPPRGEHERSPIVAARFAGRSATEIANHLKSERIAVSARRGMVRFSPHLYNEVADVERALGEIARLLGVA